MNAWGKPRGPKPIEGQDGNWKCTSCATINFATRTECHHCRRPFPGGTMPMNHVPFPDQGPPMEGPAGPRFFNAPIEGIGGNWRCPNCANVNFAKRENCNRCHTNRPPLETILAREQELEQERALAAASGATLPNMQPGSGRKWGPPVAGVDGNWECLTCSSVNFASREICHRCQSGRPPQEHIKARAEQIKTERAVAIASSGGVGGALPQPSAYSQYYPGYSPDQIAAAPPGAYPQAQSGIISGYGAQSQYAAQPYPYEVEVPSKRQRVEDADRSHGSISRGPSLRGGTPMEGITQGCDLPNTVAQAQMLATLKNLEAVLTAAGSSKRQLIDVQVHVMESADLEGVQSAWLTWVQSLDGQLPCKTVLIGPSSSGLEGCRVEIKAVAKSA